MLGLYFFFLSFFVLFFIIIILKDTSVYHVVWNKYSWTINWNVYDLPCVVCQRNHFNRVLQNGWNSCIRVKYCYVLHLSLEIDMNFCIIPFVIICLELIRAPTQILSRVNAHQVLNRPPKKIHTPKINKNLHLMWDNEYQSINHTCTYMKLRFHFWPTKKKDKKSARVLVKTFVTKIRDFKSGLFAIFFSS